MERGIWITISPTPTLLHRQDYFYFKSTKTVSKCRQLFQIVWGKKKNDYLSAIHLTKPLLLISHACAKAIQT